MSVNLITNIVYFVINGVIGLLLAPFFIDTLGEAAYGLIPLATSITSYVTLIIDSANASITRYLTLSLQKGEMTEANKSYNTALYGILVISLIMLPAIIVLSWFATGVFDIGDQTRITVFVLFACVFGAALIRFLSSGFMTVLFAHNRLDLRNYINIAHILIQVIFIVVTFSMFGPNLYFVGFAYLISASLTFILSKILSKKTNPYLKIHLSEKSNSQLIDMSKTSGFVIVTQIGYLLRTQLSLIIINIFIGVVAGAHFSLALTWYTLIESISSLLSNQFTPLLYSLCAKIDQNNLVISGKLIVKFVGLIMVIPIGLACVFMPQLMTLWVGEEYTTLTPLVWILITPLILRLQGNAIYPIVIAYNKVNIAAIVSIVVGVLNLVLALLFIRTMSNGMYGVAWAWFITMMLQSVIFLLYIAYIVRVKISTYLSSALPAVLGFIIVVVLGMMFNLWYNPSATFPDMILSGVVVSAVYGIIIRIFFINKDERIFVKSLLPKIIKDKIPKWLL